MSNNNEAQRQVPDQRLDQMMEQFRLLREENGKLKQAVDYYAAQTQKPPPVPVKEEDSDFQPHIDKALSKKIQKEMKQLEDRMNQANNFFADRDDLILFHQKYGAKQYDDYKDKIEGLRAQRFQQGQPLTREDAFRLVAFEDRGKKPQILNETKASEPVFDPYLGKYTTPKQKEEPIVEQKPTIQTQKPQDDDVTLPEVGMNPPSQRTQSKQRPTVGMGADEKALDAWAEEYGDQLIP